MEKDSSMYAVPSNGYGNRRDARGLLRQGKGSGNADAGYLVKGEIAAGPDDITVSITGDANVAKKLYEDLSTEVDSFLKDHGINAGIAQGEALKLEALRALVREADPTIPEEELAKMSEKQLLNVLKVSRIETAQLITQEMRDAYLKAKEYEFRFAERQAVKDVIDGMGSIYEMFMSGYSAALKSFQQAIASVEQARYNALVDTSSDYQKALAEVRAQKDKVLAQRKQVAELEAGPAKDAAEAVLKAEEATLAAKEKALKAAGDAANAAFDTVLAGMKTAENALVELEKAFPKEIKTQLSKSAQDMQNAMNKAKGEAFDKFEKAHKEDIEKALRELEERKQQLIQKNAA